MVVLKLACLNIVDYLCLEGVVVTDAVGHCHHEERSAGILVLAFVYDCAVVLHFLEALLGA